jgi:capsid protein
MAPPGSSPVLGETATARVRVRNHAVTSTGPPYTGASQTRRSLGWRAPTVSPNDAILGSLFTLRDRARDRIRNDGYAKHAIEALTSELIGTGIKPLSQAVDADFRRQIQVLWLRWTDESDADGVLDFYGQQALAVRAWLEAGEVFVRLRARRPEDGRRASAPASSSTRSVGASPTGFIDRARAMSRTWIPPSSSESTPIA